MSSGSSSSATYDTQLVGVASAPGSAEAEGAGPGSSLPPASRTAPVTTGATSTAPVAAAATAFVQEAPEGGGAVDPAGVFQTGCRPGGPGCAQGFGCWWRGCVYGFGCAGPPGPPAGGCSPGQMGGKHTAIITPVLVSEATRG